MTPHMCQNCEERPATVHLTEIVNGKHKREKHLCEGCAQEHDGPIELMGMLSSAFATERQAAAAGGLRCSECGLGYMEFRSRGRLGCPTCYQVFASSLDPLLEKIHGGTQHVGKAPDASSAVDRSRERRLVELRRELQGAVREERYEQAASLRDELQRAEDEPPPEPPAEETPAEETPAEETPPEAAVVDDEDDDAEDADTESVDEVVAEDAPAEETAEDAPAEDTDEDR